jgi:tRNA U34 2-thiouridine synthase MnmA/TrmU
MELVTAEKKTQGLCFIGSGLPEFCNKIRAKEGAIIQIDKDHSIYSTEANKNCLQKNH